MRRGGCRTVLSASVMSLVKGPDGEKPIEDWWEDDHMNRVGNMLCSWVEENAVASGG
jgi:hypothetical protein